MIHKAFVIMDALAMKKVNSITDISSLTDIPRSTVHRILQILAKEEVVTIIPDKGYVLTPKLISIGLNGIAQKDLLDIAVPFMRNIAEKTRETVSLNIISGHERVCIYRVEGDYPITRKIRIGDRAPLFRGSAGKIIASGLNDKELEAMLTKYVATGEIAEHDAPNVRRQIQEVRAQGFAVSVGERVQNSASIAVPVKDIAGFTLASLSISAFADRFNEENHKKYLQLLSDAANQISALHGSAL